VTSLLAALSIVFVAELGDKTQLVALGLGARHRIGPVLVGITIGYAAVNTLSVVVGGLLGATLPTRAIGLGGGVLFLTFAVLTLRARDEAHPSQAADLAGDGGPGDAHSPRTADAPRSIAWSAVWSAAGAIIVAELGDKTMLATATLAARDDPVLVWIGATIGIVASGMLGVLVGRAIGHRLPVRATRRLTAALFAGFGVSLLVASW
jgi:putative Ca2+/H+ antiporter (TMEM165/GDT1 family)